MINLKFKQGQDYVPIFSIPKADCSLLNINKKSFLESRHLIKDYIEDTSISPVLPILENPLPTNISLSQKDLISKLLLQNHYGKHRCSGRIFIVTQFALIDVTNDPFPIAIAMIRKDYIKYLKMSSLIEEPFPTKAVELWVNHIEHGLSTNFYNRLRAKFLNIVPSSNVKHLTKESFNTYLFQLLKKPKFLSKKQENIWKNNLLNEFRKEKQSSGS